MDFSLALIRDDDQQQSDDDPSGKKNKSTYQRHSVHQILRLEDAFKECPHPDDKERLELSRELNLSPAQVKFWFQNRRTQLKGQRERAFSHALRVENDKIRRQNNAMHEALTSDPRCSTCRGSPSPVDVSLFEEQKLRMENAHLKKELDRLSKTVSKYTLDRPTTQLLPPPQPINLSSLDDLSRAMIGAPTTDLNLGLTAGTSSSAPNLQLQPVSDPGPDVEKLLVSKIAANAADEVLALLQTDEPLWEKSPTNGREVLNLELYDSIFGMTSYQMINPNTRIESSRDSHVVHMNSLVLVDMLMNSNSWMELFPTIISKARTIDVITPGLLNTMDGALQLMYVELQVLSPLVPTREFFFLRSCQQVQQGLWLIADVSCHFASDHPSPCQNIFRRLPSGCLIQDAPNGYSKVIWTERIEALQKTPPHLLYTELIYSGFAFGAERWISTLQRVCERFSRFHAPLTQDPSHVNLIQPDGKRSMMKLGQRMVNNYCAAVSTANTYLSTTVDSFIENGIRVTVRKNMNTRKLGNELIVSAATTIWVPLSPQSIFSFFKDQRTRVQWDVLLRGNEVQEVARITAGSDPGNCISVLQASDESQGDMVLQETCVDASGSLVVFCLVDLQSINKMMSGKDNASCIPLFPSGVTISPDGQPGLNGEGGSSSSSNNNRAMSSSSGSLITIALQMSPIPSSELTSESTNMVSNLVKTTVHRIKAALDCPDA